MGGRQRHLIRCRTNAPSRYLIRLPALDYGMAACTLLNAFLALFPRTKTTAMIRPAMAATMSPYSTAVAPSSSLNNLIAFFNMVSLLRLVRSFSAPNQSDHHRAPSVVQNTKNYALGTMSLLSTNPRVTFNYDFAENDPIPSFCGGAGNQPTYNRTREILGLPARFVVKVIGLDAESVDNDHDDAGDRSYHEGVFHRGSSRGVVEDRNDPSRDMPEREHPFD